jgi:hypothetical protein|tara:strand:+ start:416 stop:1681 length:1266 start_codon:yes stop_codon:yes gene_type:complete
MSRHIFKKSQVEKGLGLKSALYETYGKNSQEIMVSEEQLNRLLEKCGEGHYEEQLTPPVNTNVEDSEDLTISMLDEVEDELELDEYFDDYKDIDHSDRDEFDGRKSRVVGVYRNDSNSAQNFEEGEKKDHDGDGDIDSDDWKSARDKAIKSKKKEVNERSSYEKGMFNPGDGADDESYDGHHFKHDVIGAYDDDLTGKSRRGEVYEDSEGEETYNYGQDEGRDEYRLKHRDMSRSHRHNLEKDMAYDEDHEYRHERGTHFYESVEGLLWKRDLAKVNFLVSETYDSIRKSILKERVRELDRRDYTLKPGMLTEQSEWGGRNPGVSAASGIENIIDNIKKAYNFLKDGKTRKQIENTLVKLDNFMSYTAELVGSGRDQRGSRSYDKIARPLPHPELDEPEELEDIDDEISISEGGDEDLELE